MTTINALSEVAALMGDPARAAMLQLLMDGRAHTASDLALTAGVTAQTLKVGDEIIMTARPSRVPNEYRALMVNLKRPSDGFTWGAREGERVD